MPGTGAATAAAAAAAAPHLGAPGEGGDAEAAHEGAPLLHHRRRHRGLVHPAQHAARLDASAAEVNVWNCSGPSCIVEDRGSMDVGLLGYGFARAGPEGAVLGFQIRPFIGATRDGARAASCCSLALHR